VLKHHFDIKKSIFIGILVVILSYTFWLVQETSDTNTNAKKSDNRPDFFAKNVYATEYDQAGKLIHKLQTPYLIHYALDDMSDLISPAITIYSDKDAKQPWFITSKTGKAIHGTDIIDLIGNVVIHQPAGPANDDVIIHTEALTVYPKQNYAKTNKLVTIDEPGINVSAIGMKVYFKEKRVELLQSAKGVYDQSQSSKKK